MHLLLVAWLSLFASSHAKNFIPAVFQDKICSIKLNEILLTTSDLEGSSKPELQWNVSGNHNKYNNDVPENNPSGPWTRSPECITDPNTKQAYCLYTNENFANGRGIVFFTQPSITKIIQSLPVFTDQNGIEQTENPPWEIKNVPGRGNGVFATRKLKRGDPIIAHSPIGIYQSAALAADHQNGYKMLHKAFGHLPAQSRKLLMRMATSSPGDFMIERINTNAFAGDFEGEPHFFLYPEAALLNHDCRPNAMYYHDTHTLIHATHASRTIQPGEEITNTYINIIQSRAERQAILQQMWKFTCSCSLCSSSKFQESDNRLARMQDLQNNLADWSESSQATPAMAEELIALYEEEHIHSAKGPGHMFAAFAYNAIGDTKMAKLHARLAVEAGLITIGLPEADEGEMVELRTNPEDHWSFMIRRVGN